MPLIPHHSLTKIHCAPVPSGCTARPPRFQASVSRSPVAVRRQIGVTPEMNVSVRPGRAGPDHETEYYWISASPCCCSSAAGVAVVDFERAPCQAVAPPAPAPAPRPSQAQAPAVKPPAPAGRAELRRRACRAGRQGGDRRPRGARRRGHRARPRQADRSRDGRCERRMGRHAGPRRLRRGRSEFTSRRAQAPRRSARRSPVPAWRVLVPQPARPTQAPVAVLLPQGQGAAPSAADPRCARAASRLSLDMVEYEASGTNHH